MPTARRCDEVAERGYLGFTLSGPGVPGGRSSEDGVIRRLQPDVRMVQEMMAALNLPTFDSLPPDAARGLLAQINSQRPPGLPVGEIRDGTCPVPAGALDYRLYRPATPARTRWWCTSTVAAGCWAVTTPTTRCCATCAAARAC